MEIHSRSRTLEAPRGNCYAPARGMLDIARDDDEKCMVVLKALSFEGKALSLMCCQVDD